VNYATLFFFRNCDLIAGIRNAREYSVFLHARNTYVSYYYITIHRRTQSDWQSRRVELNIRRSKILESKDPSIRRFSNQRNQSNLSEIKIT